jgi:hypothetical protein
VFPLIALVFIVAYTACFVVETMMSDPSLNNILGFLLGSLLLFVVCRSVVKISSMSGNKLLNISILPRPIQMALVISSAISSVVLYKLTGGVSVY